MNNKSKMQHWDDMYKMPLVNIPWEIKDAPKELNELFNSGQIVAGRALDIACGTGNYSFFLAKHGFEVTGIDFSKRAINIAIKNGKKLKLSVNFIIGDITNIGKLFPEGRFNFILDYSILHHLEPNVTRGYAQQCSSLLSPGGKLLLVCYSDKDEFAGGSAAAKGTYGNTMYYRTTDEIRKAYSGLKEVFYKETRLGRRSHHIAHCFLFEKV